MPRLYVFRAAAAAFCCGLLLGGCAGRHRAGKACPPGMVAYWSFDEGSALDPDRSFLYGSAGYAPGVSGMGLEMDGDGQALFHGLDSLDALKQVTVEGWVKYRSMSRSDPGSNIFCKGGAICFKVGCTGSESKALAVNMQGVQIGNYARGNTELTPGKWHHAAFTFDGITTKIYLDGRLNGQMVAQGTIVPDQGRPGIIGRYPPAAAGYQSPLYGNVDEIAVYDRPLTAEEIASHYRLGLAGKGYCEAE